MELMDKIMSGILKPEDAVESFLILTPQERANIASQNGGLTMPKFLTIYRLEDIPEMYTGNMNLSYKKALALEQDYGSVLLYTSVFRSMAHHQRAYKAINEARAKENPPRPPLPVPTKSNHLFFKAWDAKPKDKPIAHYHSFLTEAKLEQHDIWMEHESHTPAWGHTQTEKYPSWVPGKPRKFHI